MVSKLIQYRRPNARRSPVHHEERRTRRILKESSWLRGFVMPADDTDVLTGTNPERLRVHARPELGASLDGFPIDVKYHRVGALDPDLSRLPD